MLAVNPSGAGTPFSTIWRRSPTWFFRQPHPPRGAAATDAHYPRHFRNRRRSGRQRLVASLPRPGGHTIGFTNIEGSNRQVAGVATLRRNLSWPSRGRGGCSRRGGDRHVCGRYVRTRIRGWRFYGDSGSLHVQPERTDHFADCPSPPSTLLAQADELIE